LFKALLIDYWYMLVIYLAIIFALVSATFRIRKHAVHKKQKTSVLIYRSILLIIILGIGIIGLRGGLQLKPINLIDAGKMVTYKQIPLLLNTPFSIIVTQGKQSLEIKTWQSQEEADAFFNPIHNYHKQENTFNKKNVILIILESFSADKVGYFNPSAKSLTPNLDSILNHSLTYKGLANGKKSIEGVPAILSSIPSLMQQPFLISSYASNHFSSLASILKEEDYSSAFFHGGKNGTMNLDSYALQAGFESYFGMDEYPNKEDYDGSWGIWDHSFYPFFKSKIGLLKEPFIASFFSLSSHHPYAIPEEYQDLFSHLEPIDASIAYADFALAQFFSSVRKEAWFMNTLFVITADHTAQNSSTIDSTGMIYFEIPIVFYSAQDSLISKIKHRKLAQQIDILPSVLDYIGYPSPFIAFGSSVFDTKAMDFTLYYMNGIYRGQYANLLFEFDGDKFSYTPSHNIINEIPLAELLPFENKLRALIQNYAYFIINNKLTIEK